MIENIELDSFKEGTIKNYIQLTKLFIELVEGNVISEKTISLMKKNHEIMRLCLQDLGVTYNDKDLIKELREKILELENKDDAQIDYSTISAFVSSICKKLTTRLEAMGVPCSCHVEYSPDMLVTLNFYPSDISSPSKHYYKTEEEYNKELERIKEKRRFFVENFDFKNEDFDGEKVNENSESLFMIYSDNNINKIKQAIEEELNLKSQNLTVDIKNVFYRTKDHEMKIASPALDKIKLSFLTSSDSMFLFKSFESIR